MLKSLDRKIEERRADVDAIEDKQWSVWHTYGKTRKVHPDERARDAFAHFKFELGEAKLEFNVALMDRHNPALLKVLGSRRIPDRAEANALQRSYRAKLSHFYRLRELGYEFGVRASEIVEANVDQLIAELLFEDALKKNNVCNIDGCRPPKRHVVFDGPDGAYFHTGKYVWIDGERLPEVRMVQ